MLCGSKNKRRKVSEGGREREGEGKRERERRERTAVRFRPWKFGGNPTVRAKKKSKEESASVFMVEQNFGR